MITENSAVLAVVSLGVIAVSITVHEFVHGYVSNRLGDDTARLSGRLSLNPIRHIDPLTTILLPIVLLLVGLPPFGAAKPVPVNPARLRYGDYGSALVSVAGPLSNLLLAVLGGIVLKLGTLSSNLWITWWGLFVMINIGFFIFNMIPFPPLDGSRVLYAFAPEPLQRFMYQIERMGIMAIFIFMMVIFPIISPVLRDLHNGLISLLASL